MQEDPVRMWRPSGEERVLLMAGPTSQYGMDPRGEYVFGIVDGKNPMRSRRGRERRLVQPGQLVAWDPSATHEGSAVEREPWTSRLMVIEVADLEALSHDPDSNSLADVHFPVPVLDDPLLAVGFNNLFQAFDSASTRLERDERLAEWLQNLIAHSTVVRPRRSVTSDREERALQIAFDYLGDQPERNVGLDELAGAADLGKFRLIRLFRERTGLPPHALQIAHRIRLARRLLEDGEPIAQTAAAAGFADQSHLHRHFERSLGLTPAKYQQRFRRG